MMVQVMLPIHNCSIYIWTLVYTHVYKMCVSAAISCRKVVLLLKRYLLPIQNAMPFNMCDWLVTTLFGSWCHSVKMLNFVISHITDVVE